MNIHEMRETACFKVMNVCEKREHPCYAADDDGECMRHECLYEKEETEQVVIVWRPKPRRVKEGP